MAFTAKVLADSITKYDDRLTTLELTFPRCILAEFNTHRMISKNAASSRAIPTEKLIQRIVDDPFIPDFRLNQKGMQAGEELDTSAAEDALMFWNHARMEAIATARDMHKLNIHKQYVNRLLEPWMWCTVIASATEWANLFYLRCSPEAEPSFQVIANMAYDAIEGSTPAKLRFNEWHLPLIFDEDRAQLKPEDLCKVSVGRCARVSHLTHDGKREPLDDIELHDRLVKSGHWSPFEHVAQAGLGEGSGNFWGFTQYRKMFEGENVTEFTRQEN